MNNYYFTFGPDHYNINGQCMRPYWVRVVAWDYAAARQLFISGFMIGCMQRKDAFCNQREEAHFIKKYFPGGEYIVIGDYNKTVIT